MHYIQPSAGHLINCLFIWQIPRRSTGEDRKRYLTVAKASWKRPNHLRVWVRICLRTHYECIVCQWHACLLRCWKHRALASTLQWMPDFIYYFDGQRNLPADSHVLPELLWPYFLILLCPFVVLLNYLLYARSLDALAGLSDLLGLGGRGGRGSCGGVAVGTVAARPWRSPLPLYSSSIWIHSAVSIWAAYLGLSLSALTSQLLHLRFVLLLSSWTVSLWEPEDHLNVPAFGKSGPTLPLDVMGYVGIFSEKDY